MATYILIDARLREEFEKLELAQRAKTKESVFKRQDLLDRYLPAGGLVHSSNDGPVRAFSEAVQNAIVVA